MDYVADFQTVAITFVIGVAARANGEELNRHILPSIRNDHRRTTFASGARYSKRSIGRRLRQSSTTVTGRLPRRRFPRSSGRMTPRYEPIAFDPSRAARELNAAGWKLRGDGRVKDGPALVVQLAYPAGWELGPERRSCKRISHESACRPSSTSILRTCFSALPDGISSGGRFNLAWTGFSGGSDPEQSEIWTCDRRAPNGPNVQRWCDPRYDRFFAEQSRRLNRSSRRMFLNAMQRIVRDAVLFVPLVYPGTFSAQNPAVRGWNPNMLFEFSNSEDWDVVP